MNLMIGVSSEENKNAFNTKGNKEDIFITELVKFNRWCSYLKGVYAQSEKVKNIVEEI